MKNLVKLLSLALVLVMALSLAGCGSPEKKIVGEWKAEMDEEFLTKMFGVEADELEEYGFDEAEMSLEFDGEGEVTVTMDMGELGEETETSEYEFDGDTLIIDGEEQEYEFKGSKTLILDFEGMGEVEFKKQ